MAGLDIKQETPVLPIKCSNDSAIQPNIHCTYSPHHLKRVQEFSLVLDQVAQRAPILSYGD